MRFKADGPAIPDILLEERDAGNVVFLCGAGVSIRAGMPDFLGLTQHVIDEVGPSQDSEIRQALEARPPSRRSASRSPSQDSEIRQALEALDETSPAAPTWRRPSLDELFQLLHQEYGRDQVARIVWNRLKSVESSRTREHGIVTRISATAEGHPQIVTTNFDQLFELALADRKPAIYKPPMYPDLRHGIPATGITYLHGRLADTEFDTHDYILSSADLGRAYLAEGWATAFVRQLLERYAVVLLGYRAEDPPLKYLLQGLDSAGGQARNRLFAFDEGNREEVKAKWSGRGVQVIPYGDSHDALWETLEAWAHRADNPTVWRSTVVELSGNGPRELAPYERGMVAHLVKTTSGAKQFADAKPAPPAEWLCSFDVSRRYAKPATGYGRDPKAFDPLEEYGLDDDPSRPREDEQRHDWPGDNLISWRRGDDSVDHRQRLSGVSWPPSEPMPARLRHLARWLTSRVNDPALAWWVAKQPALHPRLHEMLKRAVEDSDALGGDARRGWMTLFEALESGSPSSVDMEWIDLQTRIGKQGWTPSVVRALESATEPVFTVNPQYGLASVRSPSGDWSKVRWKDVADLGVHFPALTDDRPVVPDAALESVYAALERNLMRASERIRELEMTWFHLQTFYAEEGGERSYTSNPDEYVGWFREILNRLAERSPGWLGRHIALWPDADPPIFDKLRLYVWSKRNLFSGDEAAGRILALSDDQFWRSEHGRELMFLLRDRWTDFPAECWDAIGRRILDGPPGRHDEDEARRAVRSAMTAAGRFGWLVQAGCSLSASLRAKWTALKSGLPEWQDSWVDGVVATNDLRAGRVGTNDDASVLDGLPIGKIVQVAQERSGITGDPFVENRPFTGLVKNSPRRAITALGAATRQGEFPNVLWHSVIRDWPDHAPRRATKLLHGRLGRLPCTTIDALRDTVGDWMRDGFPKAAGDDKALAYDVFDHFVGCLLAGGAAATESAIGEQTIAGEPIQGARQTLMHAINGPIGKAVEGLLKEFGNGKPTQGSALPADLEARLDRLLAAPGEGSGHATCVLSRSVAWLHHLDSAWVAANMIPWFHREHHRSEPAWSGILWNSWARIQPVFGEIKASFLDLPPRMYRWASREETEQYCHWVVDASLLAGDDGPRLSFLEARQSLRQINQEGRQRVIWRLAQVGAGNHDGWQELVIPFIRQAWPNEHRYQTGETTDAWLSLLKRAEDSFPEVLAAVRDHLRPVNSGRLVLYPFYRQAGTKKPLTTKFPREALDLVDRVVADSSQDAPYGLADVLGTACRDGPGSDRRRTLQQATRTRGAAITASGWWRNSQQAHASMSKPSVYVETSIVSYLTARAVARSHHRCAAGDDARMVARRARQVCSRGF